MSDRTRYLFVMHNDIVQSTQFPANGFSPENLEKFINDLTGNIGKTDNKTDDTTIINNAITAYANASSVNVADGCNPTVIVTD